MSTWTGTEKLKEIFEVIPSHVCGDDRVTSATAAAIVLIAAELAMTTEVVTIAEMTKFPQCFVDLVLDHAESIRLRATNEWDWLVTDLHTVPLDRAKVEDSLWMMMESFWRGSPHDLAWMLEVAREGTLFGGEIQTWTDEENDLPVPEMDWIPVSRNREVRRRRTRSSLAKARKSLKLQVRYPSLRRSK